MIFTDPFAYLYMYNQAFNKKLNLKQQPNQSAINRLPLSIDIVRAFQLECYHEDMLGANDS